MLFHNLTSVLNKKGSYDFYLYTRLLPKLPIMYIIIHYGILFEMVVEILYSHLYVVWLPVAWPKQGTNGLHISSTTTVERK